jgi:thiamine biosynthesis lipoprotein
MCIKPIKLSRLFVVISFFLAFILVLLSAFTGYSAEESVAMEWRRQAYPVMGTMVEISLYGKPAELIPALDDARTVFNTIHQVCNIFDTDSELSRLNATAADKPVQCSPLLWEILQISRFAYDNTGHAFDISAKPLMDLWGFYRKRNSLPDTAEINTALAKVGLNKVIFDEKNRTVKFTVTGMAFDLGGIAKGFALDRAVTAVKKHHIATGIINAGGNIYCLPQPPPGKEYSTIGIRNPMDKEQVCGMINLNDTAVSTSGGYERFVAINGKTYGHIMNPETGVPASEILAVTVVVSDATLSDYLSTAIFVNGVKSIPQVSKTFPDASGIIFYLNSAGGMENIKFGPKQHDFQLLAPEQSNAL